PSPAQPVAMLLVYARGGRAPTRHEVRVKPKQCARDAVGPAEAVLKGILASAAGKVVFDVVLLDQLALVGEDALHGREPAAGYLVRQRRLVVAAEAHHRDPLQGRPTIGRIP